MSNGEPERISERRLESEDFVVLNIPHSKTDMDVDGGTVRTKQSTLWFFQVVDTSELTYSPLFARDDNGMRKGPIEPGQGVEFDQLYDEYGDDILRNTDDPWRIYHYSLGVKQPNVRVYPRIPDTNRGGGFSWLSGSEPEPTAGDNVGYIESSKTTYADPSTQLESFVYKQDSLTQHQYGFYVEDGTVPTEPILSLSGFAYETRPVHRTEDMFQILADLGSDSPENNVRLINWARQGLRSFDFNVPSEWNTAENTLTIQDVNTSRDIREELGILARQLDGEAEGEEDSVIESPDVPRREG